MIVAHLSGSSRRAQHCQKQLLRSYQLPGDRGQRNVTMGTSNGLLTFVINGRQIPRVFNQIFQYCGRLQCSKLCKVCIIFPYKTSSWHSFWDRSLSKQVFNIRPALPRYVTTWNVSKVFQYLKKQQALVNCDLKTVSHRLAILLCPTKGQLDQTVKFLNLECLKVIDDKAILLIPDKLKTTRAGHHLPPLALKVYKDVELCVLSHLRQYIS